MGIFQKRGERQHLEKLLRKRKPQRSIRHYQNGKANGVFVFFFSNGDTDMVNSFADNRKDGEWKSWDTLGKLTSITHYQKDKKEGLWTYYYIDGNIKNQGTFVKDKKEGHFTSWYDNGNKESDGDFHDNKETGKWQSWYRNWQEELKDVVRHVDSLIYMDEYFDSQGKQTVKAGNGDVTIYYATGGIQTTGRYENGLKEGLWRRPILLTAKKKIIVQEKVRGGNKIVAHPPERQQG